MRSLYDILHLQAWYTRVRRMVCLRIREMAKRIHKSVLFETCFSLFNNQKAAPGLLNEGCLGRLFISFLQLFGSQAFKRGVSCLMFLCGFVTSGFSQVDVSQNKQTIDLVKTGLQVGDTISPINLGHVYNHPSSNLMLPSGKADLTIIDFWATWCGACIAALPKMDSLKHVFDGELDFLSVTYQDSQLVKPFWETLEKRLGKPLNIPVVTNDSLLRQLFPHKTLPHYVWLDRQGVVKAITDLNAINEHTIRSVLSNEDSVSQKRDYKAVYDRNEPLFLNGNGGDADSLTFRSVISGYVEGVSGQTHYNRSYRDAYTKLTFINTSLSGIFSTVYGALSKLWIGRHRIKLAVTDPDRFSSDLIGEPYLEWLRHGNGYCYEVIVAGVDNKAIYEVMRDELVKIFPQYKVSVQPVRTKCIALIKTDSYQDIKSAGGEHLAKITADRCFIQNASLDYLTSRLDYYFLQGSPYPIINATGITDLVDLEFEAPLSDIDAMNKELDRYGLRFEEGIYETEMLIIEDSPGDH